jgi:hypothetical protein
MTRYLLFAFLIGFSITRAPAQLPVRYLELTPPQQKVSGSLYRHIEFLDSRPDTTWIGPIEIGGFNNIDARLIFKTPIQPQLQRLIDSIDDPTARDGSLLFQLRDISFVEPWRIRYLFVKATLYVRTDSSYRKLSTIDLTDLIKDYEVGAEVNKIVNQQLDGFIAAALTRPAADSAVYTLRDIAHIDSIEEHSLPLYTGTSFTDGIYLHYASFSRQVPDKQGVIKAKKDGAISSVHIFDDSARSVKLRSKDVYAIVYKGKPYIATEYGFYPLERVRDNFFFTGDIRVAATSNDYIMAFGFTGLIGIFAASRGYQETYDLLIDPLTGNFVHLRRIGPSQTP